MQRATTCNNAACNSTRLLIQRARRVRARCIDRIGVRGVGEVLADRAGKLCEHLRVLTECGIRRSVLCECASGTRRRQTRGAPTRLDRATRPGGSAGAGGRHLARGVDQVVSERLRVVIERHRGARQPHPRACANVILSDVIRTYPNLSELIRSDPVLSEIIRSDLISYPIRCYPMLSYPMLSYPVLSEIIRSYLISYPIRSYPVLSYPIRLSVPVPCTPMRAHKGVWLGKSAREGCAVRENAVGRPHPRSCKACRTACVGRC